MKWFKLAAVLLVILTVNIVLKGLGYKYSMFYKNEIEVKDVLGNVVKYQLKDKNIMVFSTDCESCREELMLLGKQEEVLQKKIELISISDSRETISMLKKYKVVSKVFIDYRKDFSVKFNVSSVPAVYNIVDNTVIRNDDFLKQLIKN